MGREKTVNRVLVSGQVGAKTDSGFWLNVLEKYTDKRGCLMETDQAFPVKATDQVILGDKVFVEGRLSTENRLTFIVADRLEKL